MSRILVALMLTAVTSLCSAEGVGRIGNVVLVDQESGDELVPHLYKGEYWVAGVPGARYAIEIHNRLGERLLAVASVDGVNVITGETAAWDQNGYVFSPDERFQIKGWRKSNTEVAAFTFTALPGSYAARTGRPANVGVIGVALFREQPPQVSAVPQGYGFDPANASAAARSAPSAPSVLGGAADVSRNGTAAAALNETEEVVVTGSRVQKSPSTASPKAADKLGTGHGEREYSYVVHVDFTRLQSQPNELIRIHYDSVENLTAMGIIRPSLPQPPFANPFPGSPTHRYVPDPPG